MAIAIHNSYSSDTTLQFSLVAPSLDPRQIKNPVHVTDLGRNSHLYVVRAHLMSG